MRQKSIIGGLIVTCLLVFSLTGCNSAETKKISQETADMAIKFNELVKAGKTTRAQEQAYIASVANVVFQLDRAIRGTTAAQATQKQAQLEAANGVDLNAPLNLDSLQPKLQNGK